MKDYKELQDIKDSTESLINSAFNEGYEQGFEDGTANAITKRSIESLVKEYRDTLVALEEARSEEHSGIGMSHALITGKIGVYGKAIADLTELLESEGNV